MHIDIVPLRIRLYAFKVTFIRIGEVYAYSEYREFIKKLHPTQFLTGRLTAPLYEVEYSYVTVRGNYRKAYKYILLRLEHDDLDLEIEMIFSDWVEELNRKCPYRRILNAQILKIKPIAYATIPFEI